MRHVTLRLSDTEGELHPFGTDPTRYPDIGQHAVHHFNVIDDENAVVLVEFDGSADRPSELVDRNPDVVSATISESGGSTFVFARVPPDEWSDRLSVFMEAEEVFLEMPMYYTGTGGLEVTAVGRRKELQLTVTALPDDIAVEVLSTGEYAPSHRRLYDSLTRRQLETLRTAVKVGYYDKRNVSYGDVGEELGISGDTVGEHLRKIESTIFTEVVQPDEPSKQKAQ